MSDHTDPAPLAGQDGAALPVPCSPDLAPLFWRPARIGTGSAWWGHVPFAHWLVAAIRPRTLVELGTHRGVSYAAFCEAVMRQGLDTRCSAVDTWQGDAHAGFYDDSVLAELRSFHDARYGAFSNLIQSSFDAALDYFGDGTVDLLHIDGLHTYEAVAHDFASWQPKLSSRAVVLFHDINVRENAFGVWQFWEEQCRRYPHFAFFHAHGLGVLAVGEAPPAAIQALCSITSPPQANAVRERFALIGERWTLEYRDELRKAEIVQMSAERVALTGQLATAQQELGVLRPHLADLEQARTTLDDALRTQVARSNELAEQLAGAQQELGVLRSHLADLEQARATLDDALREQIARADALTEQLAVSRWRPRTAAARPMGIAPVTPSSAADQSPRPTPSGDASKMRRVCLFSFYDEQGIVDDYVVFFLSELREFVGRIIFYSNGPLTRDAEIALRGCVDEVILRPNEGFDVLAYKEGLEKIGFDGDGAYDEVLMVNHTCYGPVYPFSELFDEMERRTCDFWGVTAHMAMTPNPLTGTGTLPYHLNANFIAVRRDMLRSQTFRKYWEAIKPSDTYEKAILSHEAVFTEYFTGLGYTADSYLACGKYGSHYPAILDLDETLIDRNPLIKRRAFFHDPRFLEHYAADLPRALRVLEATSDYDQSMIWRNIVRSAELRTLNTNAALTTVLPDVRIKQDAPLPDYGRLAVCVHVYYTEMLDEILALTDTIPMPFDFIATTDSEEKKGKIVEFMTGRRHVSNVIVIIVEQNRGRDMSALFISCREFFLDDTYDLVCRLHTKKTPQLARGQGNLFKRHMFENLLNSEGFTANVLDMFHDKPWIGVAIPPVVQISYWTLGHSWYTNRAKAEEVSKLLDLKVRLDPDTPIAAYGTMFWFRPKALRKLFAHPWKWTDFNAEPHHVDGGLAHVLERLICYVAQDARYTTQQILSTHLAAWNYGVLEYKLQKLCAALPNSDFTYLSHMLEEWKRVGYPMQPQWTPPPIVDAAPPPVVADAGPPEASAPVAEPPSSVRQELGELLLATKKSVAYRSPVAFKILRPVYRVVTGRVWPARPAEN